MEEPAFSIPRQPGPRELRQRRGVVRPVPSPGPRTDVEVAGHLDATTTKDLASRLSGSVTTPAPFLRLDLTRVESFSFAGQVIMLAFARSLRRRGGALELYGPTAGLREQTLQLDLFRRIPTIEEMPPS